MVDTDEVRVPIKADDKDFDRVFKQVEKRIGDLEKKGRRGRGVGGKAFVGGAVGGVVGSVAGGVSSTLLQPLLSLGVNLIVAALLPFVKTIMPGIKTALEELTPIIKSAAKAMERVIDFLGDQGVGNPEHPLGRPIPVPGSGGRYTVGDPIFGGGMWGPVVDRARDWIDKGGPDELRDSFQQWFWKDNTGGQAAMVDPDFEGNISGSRSSQTITGSGE